MASISTDKQGRKRILFVNPAGERKALRLGKVAQRSAESIKYRVESLVESLMFKRPMDADLAGWVIDQEPVFAKRLARVGLIPEPERKAAMTLGPFMDGYIAGRVDVKPATKEIWRTGQGGPARVLWSRPPAGGNPSRRRRPLQAAFDRQEAGLDDRSQAAAIRHDDLPGSQPAQLIVSDPFADVSIKAAMPDRERFITAGRNRSAAWTPAPIRLAGNRRPGPLRRPALPERSAVAPLAGRGLGNGADRRSIPQDGTSSRQGHPDHSVIPRTAGRAWEALEIAARWRGVRGRRTAAKSRQGATRLAELQPADPV